MFHAVVSLLATSYSVENPEAKSHHWAVLIAGSNGYGNYRHQADVCHAYQIMVKSGIPKKQIITLAVDDIANNRENPFPGKLFNKPTPKGTPGVDVYEGCNIDYSGKDVTPGTFTKVLTGDKAGLLAATGKDKVLESTKDDRVFINFVDHGAAGLIGFPSTSKPSTMHAKELMAALTTMHSQKMYSELTFYLEACESGSMFEGLLDPSLNIYATTASNAKESSWGTYCMPDDKVDGVELKSCLGDLYSVNWMEDADMQTEGSETLQEQYEAIKITTNKSHVMQYGDLTITSEPTTNFEGSTDMASALLGRHRRTVAPAAQNVASLPSPDAELASAFGRFMSTGSDVAAEELIRGVQDRQTAKTRFAAISATVAGRELDALPPHNLPAHIDCHFLAHKAYIAHCGEWTSMAMPYSATLAQLCKHTEGEASSIVAAIASTCA